MKSVKYFLSILCCLFSLHVMPQSLQGVVLDAAQSPIEGANVLVRSQKDSTIWTGTTTDTHGRYQLSVPFAGGAMVTVSFIGLRTAQKKVFLLKTTTTQADFNLSPDEVLLKEVSVLSTGIVVEGDTTRYLAHQFTDGRERTLSDLLNKLPGIRVDADSKRITANGKAVSRVLLEKQDLFQGNTAVPLESIDPDAVKNIEVIDHYNEFNLLEGFKRTDETVVNLNVHEKIKGKLTGQTLANGGILRSKYELKGQALGIGKRRMFSAIVANNNVGKPLLRFQDIIQQTDGGISQILSADRPMEKVQQLMKTYAPFLNSKQNIYRRENGMLALNSIFIPSKKWKIQVSGMIGRNKARAQSENRYDYFDPAWGYEELWRDKDKNIHYLLTSKVSYQHSPTLQLVYTGNLLHHTQDQLSDYLLRNNTLIAMQELRLFRSQQTWLLIKKYGEHSLHFTAGWDYQRQTHAYRQQADSTGLAFDPTLRQYDYDKRSSQQQYSAGASYLHRFSDYFLKIGAHAQLQKRYLNSALHTSDSNRIVRPLHDSLWNDVYIRTYDYKIHASWVKDKGKFTFQAGADLRRLSHRYHLQTQRWEEQSKTFIQPHISLGYKFRPTHILTLSYDYTLRLKEVEELAQGVQIIQYNQWMAGADARYFQQKAHQIHAYYLLSMLYQGFNVMANLTYERQQQESVRAYTRSGIIQRMEYRTAPSGNLFSAMLNLQKQTFSAFLLDIQGGGTYQYRQSHYYYDEHLMSARQQTYQAMLGAQSKRKKGINISANVLCNWNFYRSEQSKNNIYQQQYTAKLSYHQPHWKTYLGFRLKGFKMDGSSTQYYSAYDVGAEYQLSKKWRLTFIGEDILHLRQRVQTEGIALYHYAIRKILYYLPGSIRIGISWKY